MNARQSGSAKRAEGGGGGLGQHGDDEAPVNRLKSSSSIHSLSELTRRINFLGITPESRGRGLKTGETGAAR